MTTKTSVDAWEAFQIEAELLREDDMEALMNLQNRIGAYCGTFHMFFKSELTTWIGQRLSAAREHENEAIYYDEDYEVYDDAPLTPEEEAAAERAYENSPSGDASTTSHVQKSNSRIPTLKSSGAKMRVIPTSRADRFQAKRANPKRQGRQMANEIPASLKDEGPSAQ